MRDPMTPCTGLLLLSCSNEAAHSLRFAHSDSISHLQVFSSLVALRRLTVNNCPRVGDNGMQVLRHLPQLTHLNLCGCIKVRWLSIPGQRPAACSNALADSSASHTPLCASGQGCAGCISALDPCACSAVQYCNTAAALPAAMSSESTGGSGSYQLY